MTKNKRGMTEAEALAVKAFLAGRFLYATPASDRGSCVLGNCIRGYVVQKGRRIPSRVVLANNIWTQCEQEAALTKMLSEAKAQFPDLAKFMIYDCGNID